MKKIVIFGNSNFSKIVHHYVTADGDLEVTAFTVNKAYISSDNQVFCQLPVVPFETIQISHPPDQFDLIIAVGYSELNKTRQKIFKDAKDRGYQFASFVHPTSFVSKSSVIGEHVLIFENNTIQPFVEIGNNVIIWSNNVVGHDSVIEDHCFISSNTSIGGYARIGNRSMLGIASTVTHHTEIGKDCLIGAGALILQNTKDGGIYRGSASKRSSAPSLRLKI